MSKLLRTTELTVSQSKSPIGFEPVELGGWFPNRYLTVEGKRAYDLGVICGTCAFIFERMYGAAATIDVRPLTEALASGVDALTANVVDHLAQMMPNGRYLALLLEISIGAVTPGQHGDYFTEEHLENWGVDNFFGLPHNPKVSYYRSVGKPRGRSQYAWPVRQDYNEGRVFFEFVAPMFARAWLDAERTRFYRSKLEAGAKPTAVAISVLDVREPATTRTESVTEEHWCLTHYLLDGHHKFEAAAQTGMPISLISFLAVERGVSTKDEIQVALSSLDFVTQG